MKKKKKKNYSITVMPNLVNSANKGSKQIIIEETLPFPFFFLLAIQEIYFPY